MDGLRHFLEVALRFQAVEGTRSPLVTAWLIGQLDPLSKAFNSWRRVSLIPFLRVRSRAAVAELIGELIGVMTMWSNGVVPDSAFGDPQRTPRQVTEFALNETA